MNHSTLSKLLTPAKPTYIQLKKQATLRRTNKGTALTIGKFIPANFTWANRDSIIKNLPVGTKFIVLSSSETFGIRYTPFQTITIATSLEAHQINDETIEVVGADCKFYQSFITEYFELVK